MFWKKFVQGFYYANDGIVYAIATQRNMKIHVSIALAVLLLAMGLHFSKIDSFIVLLLIGFVFSAEIMNTAIEKTIDLLVNEFHPKAKIAKDLAAGGVLMTAVIAVFIGCFIIVPYLSAIFIEGQNVQIHSPSFFALQGLFLFILTYIAKAFWYIRNKERQPYVFWGTLVFFSAAIGIYSILASCIILAGFILLAILLKRINWSAFSQNLIISFGGFYVLFRLFF